MLLLGLSVTFLSESESFSFSELACDGEGGAVGEGGLAGGGEGGGRSEACEATEDYCQGRDQRSFTIEDKKRLGVAYHPRSWHDA